MTFPFGINSISASVDDIIPIRLNVTDNGTARLSAQVQIPQGFTIHLIGKVLYFYLFEVCRVLPFERQLVHKSDKSGITTKDAI